MLFYISATHGTWLRYQICIKTTHSSLRYHNKDTKCMKNWPNYLNLAKSQVLFYKHEQCIVPDKCTSVPPLQAIYEFYVSSVELEHCCFIKITAAGCAPWTGSGWGLGGGIISRSGSLSCSRQACLFPSSQKKWFLFAFPHFLWMLLPMLQLDCHRNMLSELDELLSTM